MQARFVAEARKKELFAMIEAAFCASMQNRKKNQLMVFMP